MRWWAAPIWSIRKTEFWERAGHIMQESYYCKGLTLGITARVPVYAQLIGILITTSMQVGINTDRM